MPRSPDNDGSAGSSQLKIRLRLVPGRDCVYLKSMPTQSIDQLQTIRPEPDFPPLASILVYKIVRAALLREYPRISREQLRLLVAPLKFTFDPGATNLAHLGAPLGVI